MAAVGIPIILQPVIPSAASPTKSEPLGISSSTKTPLLSATLASVLSEAAAGSFPEAESGAVASAAPESAVAEVDTSLGFHQNYQMALSKKLGIARASATRAPDADPAMESSSGRCPEAVRAAPSCPAETARAPLLSAREPDQVPTHLDFLALTRAGAAAEAVLSERDRLDGKPPRDSLSAVAGSADGDAPCPVRPIARSKARPVLAFAESFALGRMSAGESASVAFEICKGSKGSRAFQRSRVKKPTGKEGTPAPWHCAHVRRLGRAPDCSWNPALDSVWSRWAKCAEGVAGEHVRTSFGRLLSGLVGASSAATTSTVEVSLAFAGVGSADHEATMRQTEQLCREQLPGCCVALVGPDELNTLVTATRNIAEQFMRTGSSQGADARDAAADLQDEDESPEDCDARRAHRFSILDFVDWYHQRNEGLSCAGLRDGVVLIVERVEEVKKDVLRDLLNSWGSACCDMGNGKIIPMSVVLGLQRPLRSRFDLFEGEPSVNLRINDAVSLFDGRQVCSVLLESLVLDSSCPLALSPQSMLWLQETFERTRSISEVLKALALLCAHLLAKAPLAALCEPLVDESPGNPGLRGQFPDDKRLRKTIHDRLKAGGADVVRLACPEFAQVRSGKEVLEEASLAAVEALYWRYRVCSSLDAWDALLCAVEPFYQGKAKLDRFHCLLQSIWPSESNDEDTQRPKEEERVDLLISTLVQRLKGQMAHTQLDRLHAALVQASGTLDAHLQSRLRSVKKGATLASGLQGWFKELRETCLQPLGGPARSVFRVVFDTGLASAVIEPCMSSCRESEDTCSQVLLAPLAAGPGYQLEEGPPDDMALLYRIFECFSGSLMPVPDVWDEFSKLAPHSADSDGVAELHVRFGQALMALHNMGLHAPVTTTQDQRQTGRPFDCWRLRKRCFGRVWLQERRSNQAAGNAAIAEAALRNEDKADEEDIWTQHADPGPVAQPPPPAFLGRPMLKRQLHPAGQKSGRTGWSAPSKETSKEPPSKKGRRARVFMG